MRTGNFKRSKESLDRLYEQFSYGVRPFRAFVLLLVLSLLVLGLIRRLVPTLESIEARLTDPYFVEAWQGLQLGDRVADFAAVDQAGQLHSSAELLAQPIVVALLEGDCAPCEQVASDLNSVVAHDSEVPIYIVVDEGDGLASRLSGAHANVLLDRKGSVSRAFRSSITPQAFGLDRTGTIVARVVPQSGDGVVRLAAYVGSTA